MRLIFQNKYKKVYDLGNGEIKVIPLDQGLRESVADGDHLQPYGKDEKKFFDKYPDLKKNPDGEIVRIKEVRDRRKRNEKEADEEQREDFDNRQKDIKTRKVMVSIP